MKDKCSSIQSLSGDSAEAEGRLTTNTITTTALTPKKKLSDATDKLEGGNFNNKWRMNISGMPKKGEDSFWKGAVEYVSTMII